MPTANNISSALERENARWRNRRLVPFAARVRDAVLTEAKRIDGADYREANQLVARAARDLKAARLDSAYDEDRLRDQSENYARLCSRMQSLESRQSFALSLGVSAPAGRTITREGAIARLDDPIWWRRQLRKVWTRGAENAMRELGMIRMHREPYASNDAVFHRAAQKRRAREFLKNSVAVNELGEQLELWKLAEKSLSNPALRRGEFMTRVRGFEEIARDLGHVAEFVTLTAPSFFHAQLAAGGRNPLYQRAIVREAQAWLCKMWARARARLKRLSIRYYGFRVAEPHHDATPHWHLLLFATNVASDTLRTVLQLVFLSDFADERGAAQHRCKFERIDAERGSATGYLAKYISKNIDGAGAIGVAEDSETGALVSEGLQRVDAWASVHGIRQFQQVGGPPVGLWREARRLREPHNDRDIERARSAADRGDWRAFAYAVGGDLLARKTSLKLERQETGLKNRYGELRAPCIVGLRYACAVAITRPHRWKIERRNPLTCLAQSSGPFRACSTRVAGIRPSLSSSSLGPVAITVRGASRAGEPSGWANPQETSQAGPT